MRKEDGEMMKLDLVPRQEGKRSFSTYVAMFIIMFVVWCVMSGKFDALHLTLGVVSSALVSYFSVDLLFSQTLSRRSFRVAAGFLAYLPWLLYQIFRSALHVLYLSFHPRMSELIDPQVIRFRSKLKSDLAKVTFANSITLTPGTITVYVNYHRDFSVHAINRYSAESLPGEMEQRIARAFGED